MKNNEVIDNKRGIIDNIHSLDSYRKSGIKLTLEELLVKCYSDRKTNNVLMELIMAVDGVLQTYGYEFKSSGDRDFVKDETHKALLNYVKSNIKQKEKI